MERFPDVLIPAHLASLWVEGFPSHWPLERRQEKLRLLLSSTLCPVGIHPQAPKGHTEESFEWEVWRYFSNKIHTGLLVSRPGYLNPYIPDLAYIDPELNLHIDIEVDEPYVQATHQPLHYLGCPKDRERNRFFREHGWVVIRFSELQVAQSATGCCKTIAGVVAKLTGDNSIMQPFRHVPTLKPMPRWTVAQAQQMAEANLRETYLQTLECRDRTPAPAQPNQRKQWRGASPQATPSTQRTVYCPTCGEGPIAWQGHYICCPTCGYDTFTP